ncbi:hypothetical protein PROFUN_03825 [Planoprotostelium fungivorum]|uniref:Uncharacterized protein n=1 Tax=Planoprotostelium fungivorum TaxID=1890364 RepID=A0A2P6NI80_9EUKA|nr:hypothetical protein PROFUN_03825 [Planoprotostelium fungivorum]
MKVRHDPTQMDVWRLSENARMTEQRRHPSSQCVSTTSCLGARSKLGKWITATITIWISIEHQLSSFQLTEDISTTMKVTKSTLQRVNDLFNEVSR